MREEETKKRALQQAHRNEGPGIRVVHMRDPDGLGRTVLCPVRMTQRQASQHPRLRRHLAPEAPPPATCAVTGAPARYRDPATGLGYASASALAEIRRRHGKERVARVEKPWERLGDGALAHLSAAEQKEALRRRADAVVAPLGLVLPPGATPLGPYEARPGFEGRPGEAPGARGGAAAGGGAAARLPAPAGGRLEGLGGLPGGPPGAGILPPIEGLGLPKLDGAGVGLLPPQ